jgi:hypothetical protein
MTVGPAHCGLDGKIQPIEPDVEWDLDDAQGRGLTSLRVILSSAMVSALMLQLYDAPSRQPSSTAECLSGANVQVPGVFAAAAVPGGRLI